MATEVEVVREGHYAEKAVFVDGLDGCGKTMLSPIVAALDRVEKLTYSYEIEHICTLHYLGRIKDDAAVALIRLLTDLKLYDQMMSREVNFRPSDLSSAFKDIDVLRYVRRLFKKGDSLIPARIRAERPILHITSHKILSMSAPVFSGLGGRAVFVEMVRHPLYMIKQVKLNMDSLINDPRDFIIYHKHGQRSVPYYAQGWEDLFLSSNSVEKAIYSIKYLTEATEKAKRTFLADRAGQIVMIPFELFVLDPDPYMEKIAAALGSAVTKNTRKMMKKQNVPRTKIAEGIGLQIYKRCGWEPPKAGATEKDELEIRRSYAVEHGASKEAILVLDGLSDQYESNYLGRERSGI